MVKIASPPEHTGLLLLRLTPAGEAVTVTVSVIPGNTLVQEPLDTSVRVKVVSTVTPLMVTSTVPPAPIVAVPLEAPL